MNYEPSKLTIQKLFKPQVAFLWFYYLEVKIKTFFFTKWDYLPENNLHF